MTVTTTTVATEKSRQGIVMAARRVRSRPLNETIHLECGHDTCMGEQNVTTLGARPPAGKLWCEDHGKWIAEKKAAKTVFPDDPPF
jgi:hypothetical protein